MRTFILSALYICLLLSSALCFYIVYKLGVIRLSRTKPRSDETALELERRSGEHLLMDAANGDPTAYAQLIQETQDLHVLGFTLGWVTSEDNKAALLRRISQPDEFHLTGLVVDPQFLACVKGDERSIQVYQLADKVELARKVRDTIEVFRELKRAAEQNGGGDEVRLIGMKMYPTHGLTLISPHTDHPRMLCSLYTTYKCGARHPNMPYPSNGNGLSAEAYQSILTDYERLRDAPDNVLLV